MAETATATSADQASSDASGAVAAPVRTCACGKHLTPGGGECEPCRKAREATLQRSALSSAAATRAVPSIVGDVLATSGRPLDATTRRPHEQRFARDFSHVRVHADARAAQSARAVDARAYTVGSHIAFGAGEFAPDTPAGAGLLGHELTHVVQQQRGTAGEAHELRVVEDPALERDADRQAVGEGRTSPPVALQRASKPGWTGSPASSLNVGQTAVGSIRRLPIENLTEGNQEDVSGAAESTKGRAIVLLHTTFDATKRADVLIHFHGHNVGYRESGGVHRDRDVYRIEQQIEASKKAQLIGVLPQGTPGSWFGASGAGKAREKSFSSDAYLRDVFAKLKSVGVWSAPPPIGNVMISGHSGAGELINEKLLGGAPTSSLPSAVGRLAEVALFDGVNGPNEFLALEKWLEGQLNADRAKVAGLPDRAARLAYLQTSMRFRAYFTDNAYYSKWHIGPLPAGDKRLAGKKPLAQFVVGWFAANAAALGGTSSAEFKALRRNYDVVQVGHPDHEQVMAQGGRLEEALSLLPARTGESPTAAGPAVPDSVVDALRSPSAPLDAGVRPGLEPTFGPNLGRVRIHTGNAAAAATRAVGAAAFTVGPQIVFAPGRYAPRTESGLALIRHELTHVRQQGGSGWRSAERTPLRLGPPDGPLEAEAERASRGVEPDPSLRPVATPLIQRAPVVDPRDVCETTKNPLPFEPTQCWYRAPENCPSYESWLNTFRLVKTFKARATPVSKEPSVPKKNEPHVFDVLGDVPAKRYGSTAKPAAPAPPSGALRRGEKFIDHATDDWVQHCLPDNLRATAYQLPSDCADIAIILRHVWLAAHRRTEEFGGFVIGDKAGRPAPERVGKVIAQVGSGNVSAMVSPYSDAQGEPIRSFAALEPMLHPGDVLVWGHFNDVAHQRGRTGGHTLTIVDLTRQNGRITKLLALEGNEPIFGGDTPDEDDKGKIIKELKAKDTKALREELGHAPGRRIETMVLGPADLGDKDVTVGKVTRPVWFWPSTTLLIAAGPPKAAPRPVRQRAGKKALKDRQLTDWIPSFAAATVDTFPGILEAALLEARSLLERGAAIPTDDATKTGTAAGQQFWKLVKKAGAPKDSLDQALLGRLPQLLAMMRSIRDGANQAARKAVATTFDEFERTFSDAAVGATDIGFRTGKGAPSLRMLLTGFGPFEATGSLATPPPGSWNPSAAAVLALDGAEVPVGTDAGKPVKAGIEGIVMPVEYEIFDRGTIERVVRPLLAGPTAVDAVITVSQGGHTQDPVGPVRIERYAVGIRDDRRPGGKLGPVPAAAPDPIGPEIIESTAPVRDIAAAVPPPAVKGKPAMATPAVGEDITFKFADTNAAEAALKALGLPPARAADVSITDESALRQIVKTMVRDANGVDIKFQAGGKTFTAKVLRGPGGDFLSNEISYRVLRELQAARATGVMSFHVHTPTAETIPEDRKDPERKGAISRSVSLRARLIETLRRVVAATGAIILARRKSKGGTP